MLALILNSGLGSRMGSLTIDKPKCLSKISETDTILSLQLKNIYESGIDKVLITTGPFEEMIATYCNELNLGLSYIFVNNPLYRETNYIYSIFLAKEHLEEKNIVMLHGDLVFNKEILISMLNENDSLMAVSTTVPLPLKDFKAVLKNDRIDRVGVEYFEDAVTAQPLYKLNKNDWEIWLGKIIEFCEKGKTTCYAENAFNEVSDKCIIKAWDFQDFLCAEIDTIEDLEAIRSYYNY